MWFSKAGWNAGLGLGKHRASQNEESVRLDEIVCSGTSLVYHVCGDIDVGALVAAATPK
jgi:hypothetical protein